MKINLLNDMVLVRRIVDDETTLDWGFVLQGEDQAETPWLGTVVAVGPGKRPKLSPAGRGVSRALEDLAETCRILIGAMPDGIRHGMATESYDQALEALQSSHDERLPMTVKVGNTVIFSKHTRQVFRINGEDLHAMGEDSVLGIVDAQNDLVV